MPGQDGRAAGVGQLHASNLRRHEWHRRVDENLAGESGADVLERRLLMREWHGQHDEVRRRGGREVRLAGDARARHRGAKLLRRGVCLFLRPGTDDDRVTGAGPASREPGAEGSGATDDRDRLDALRGFHGNCVFRGCGEWEC